jgi:hypothetical protein
MNKKVWFRLLPSTLNLWADQCLDAPHLDSLKVGKRFEIQLEAYPASSLIESENKIRFERIKDNKYSICAIIKDFLNDKFLLDCGFPIRLRLLLYAKLEYFEQAFYDKSIIEQNLDLRKEKTEEDESVIGKYISGDICLQGDFPLDEMADTGISVLQKVGGKITSILECTESKDEFAGMVYKPSTIQYMQFRELQQYTPSISSDKILFIELEIDKTGDYIRHIPMK